MIGRHCLRGGSEDRRDGKHFSSSHTSGCGMQSAGGWERRGQGVAHHECHHGVHRANTYAGHKRVSRAPASTPCVRACLSVSVKPQSWSSVRNCRRRGERDTNAPATGPPPGLGGGSFAFAAPQKAAARAKRLQIINGCQTCRHADTQSPLSRVQRACVLLASVLSGKRSRFCACCLFTAGLGGQPHSLQIKMFASSHTLLHRLQPKRKHQPMGPRTAMRHHLALCAAALCKCVRVVNISEWFPKLKTHATRAIG